MPSVTCIERLNFSSVLGYHKIRSSLFAFNSAGIIKGNESFIHRLIKLMCGTCDDLDKSPTINSRIIHVQCIGLANLPETEKDSLD